MRVTVPALLLLTGCEPLTSAVTRLADGSCVVFRVVNRQGCNDGKEVVPVKVDCPPAEMPPAVRP